jgi:Putative DNA-binding domain
MIKPVKYVDWVEQVLKGLVAAVAADPAVRTVGVAEWQLQQGLVDQQTTTGPVTEALRDAVRDLERLGLAIRRGLQIELTQTGRQLAAESLRMLWPQIMLIYLDNEQLAFLQACVRLCEERHPDVAVLRDVTWQEVTGALGWANPDFNLVFDIARKLEEAGLLDKRGGLGQRIDVFPTYAGIVRATEGARTALRQLVADLVPDWETTTVEFKRQVNLKRDKEKAEFVRDVLALATTKASGRRWLVIGFDSNTHQFTDSVDPAITQDRLEDILNAYASPAPQIRYQRVRWNGGEVGLLEVIRDPTHIPYRVTRSLAHISVDDVYVRHGSHVEPPTTAERADLDAEGQAAREQPPRQYSLRTEGS